MVRAIEKKGINLLIVLRARVLSVLGDLIELLRGQFAYRCGSCLGVFRFCKGVSLIYLLIWINGSVSLDLRLETFKEIHWWLVFPVYVLSLVSLKVSSSFLLRWFVPWVLIASTPAFIVLHDGVFGEISNRRSSFPFEYLYKPFNSQLV